MISPCDSYDQRPAFRTERRSARHMPERPLFHGRSPRPSALVGLRSLGRLHGTHSQHTWKIKICLLLSSDQNSKPTFLAPNLYVYQLCLLTRLYDFGLVHFCPQATRHSRNGYWSVRERLQMITRIVSYRIVSKLVRMLDPGLQE